MSLHAAFSVTCFAAFSLIVLRRFAHALQLEHYHTDGYLKWFWQGAGLRVYSRCKYAKIIHLFIFAIAASVFFSFGPWEVESVLLGALALVWVAGHYKPATSIKKPFVYTARVKRLFATLFIIEASIIMATLSQGERWFLITAIVFTYSQALLLAVANTAVRPLENFLQKRFKKNARRKLAGKTVVAITGSYGKTGVKEAVAHLLETAYPLLKTPGSYNTPMGLCKIINERMEPHHELFVTEMGATRKGDIKELCELAPPDVGVITATGQAHLATFGTLENIAQTKFELANALRPDGALFINSDYEAARRLAARYTKSGQELITYGLKITADYMPQNIHCGKGGSTFDLKTPTGIIKGISIRPLGRFNVMNAVAAIAVGRRFGISDDKLKAAVATLPQMEHRLELLENPGSYLVINDGFNSNPLGAEQAVETLGYFEEYRKIMVTPGIVDLGAKHEEANFNFGKTSARFCDVVILIHEKRTAPIRAGLLEGGFPEGNIKTFASLAKARPYINKIADARSVVLFENDLPDHMESL